MRLPRKSTGGGPWFSIRYPVRSLTSPARRVIAFSNRVVVTSPRDSNRSVTAACAFSVTPQAVSTDQSLPWSG